MCHLNVAVWTVRVEEVKRGGQPRVTWEGTARGNSVAFILYFADGWGAGIHSSIAKMRSPTHRLTP